MQNLDILRNYGLNRNDVSVYRSLIKLGRSKTGPIIKDTGIVSSRVYESIRLLVARGLVSYQVKNNIKYYQAEMPEQLIEEADQNIRDLKAFSSELSFMPSPLPSRNEANVYEGRHGLKAAYKQHVENMGPGETASIIAFIGDEYSRSPELRSFFSETIDRIMLKKKCHGHMITNTTINSIIQKERPDKKLYDVRYLGPRYILPYALNISKQEVLISVWSDVPIVFSIKNPVVVKAFQKNFDSLWKIAKKK